MQHKHHLRLWVALLLLAIAFPSSASATLPYGTLSSDANGNWIGAPDAFIPSAVWSGFKDPEHLFVTAGDEVFVADTGNDRIVRLNKDGTVLRTFPAADDKDEKARLSKPEGVFVSKDGEVYVADTGNRRIAVFDAQGGYLREIGQPEDAALSASYSFVPSKLAIDRRGYLYIVNKGGYQGLLQLTPSGEFAGFFGANKVPSSWIESYKRKFYSEEQLKLEQLQLPGSITNLAVDGYGFIYTINRDLGTGQLKRLNSGGVDLLQNHNFAPWIVPPNKFSFTSVAVDGNGIITLLEAENGRIYQYDQQGDLIFRFGGRSDGAQRLGLFKRATAVGLLSDGSILVADGDLNAIQLFKRTAFGNEVHQAIYLYANGQYRQSEQLWRAILLRNAGYDRAYQGIAKAEYYNGDYRAAMRDYREARDAQGYSDAFWQIRMNWLLHHFAFWMSVIFGALVLVLLLRYIGRRWGVRWLPRRRAAERPTSRTRLTVWKESLLQPLRLLRHPIAALTEIADGKELRTTVAVGFAVLAFVCLLVGRAVSSFIFDPVRFADISVWGELQRYALPWLSWVVCSYLVGSVLKGQGSFKNVFVSSSFALVPIVLFHVAIQGLSRVLTLQEQVVYTLLTKGVFLWVLVLLFIATLTVHNYNLKEAIKMVSVSLFTVACLWLFGFVLIGLIYQSVDFFTKFGEELMSRVV